MRITHLIASAAVAALLACNAQAQILRGGGALGGGVGGGFGRTGGAMGGAMGGPTSGVMGGANGSFDSPSLGRADRADRAAGRVTRGTMQQGTEVDAATKSTAARADQSAATTAGKAAADANAAKTNTQGKADTLGKASPPGSASTLEGSVSGSGSAKTHAVDSAPADTQGAHKEPLRTQESGSSGSLNGAATASDRRLNPQGSGAATFGASATH